MTAYKTQPGLLPISIDQPVQTEEGEAPLHEQMPDPSASWDAVDDQLHLDVALPRVLHRMSRKDARRWRKWFEGGTYEEVAAEESVSITAVKQSVYRINRALREHLQSVPSKGAMRVA